SALLAAIPLVQGLNQQSQTNLQNTMRAQITTAAKAWLAAHPGKDLPPEFQAMLNQFGGGTLSNPYTEWVGTPGGVKPNPTHTNRSFASGVTNFAGGLAYVHQNELLVNMPRGTSVIPASQ